MKTWCASVVCILALAGLVLADWKEPEDGKLNEKQVVEYIGAMKEINKIRGSDGLMRWLARSRNAELIVIFGEDIAALLGLVAAFGFILAAHLTGNPAYDAVGSIVIGVILILVAIFVATRVKALLLGRSADPDIQERLKLIIASEPSIERVFNVLTQQYGPYIMLAAKIKMDPSLNIETAAEKINSIERQIKTQIPEIRWCFIEPDVRD